MTHYIALRRTVTVGVVSLCLALVFVPVADAQSPTEPPTREPVHCYPLSLLCGMQFQVGPFGPFNFDILPGGSVFPPAPPPTTA